MKNLFSTSFMKLQAIKYKLIWYEKEGDAFVGECLIEEIALSELQ